MKTVRIECGFWRGPKGEIHMTIPNSSYFHTTISSVPTSPRYHPNLYSKLERLLKEEGRWTA